MSTRISLDQVRVNTPCSVPWAGMTGDDRVRFCSQCQKHVHNLSAISQSEAERLLCANAGSMCVRYRADPDGKPLTLEYASVTPPSRWRRLWPVACLVALAAGVLSFVRKPAPPPMIMGDLAPVQVPSPPPATH